jgi:two-component system, OmpR family, phosphate regulon response regulator PhoB
MCSSSVILIVEDEIAIRDMLRFALEPAGFNVLEATTTQEADQVLKSQRPQLILLDWMLPGCSGINYIKQLKMNPLTQAVPIVMLTARAEEHNKVTGLEIGADDYITKPFSPRELIARIKSVLRRGGLVVDGFLRMGKLQINPATHEVFIEKEKLSLTPAEYRLLHFLLTHPKRVYSRNQLLEHVWPHQQEITERAVDVQIRRLRDRLKPYGYHCWIQTTRGAGYQFIGEAV